MKDSNQTDIERLSLISKLHYIQRKIKGTEDSEAIDNLTSGSFEHLRKK